MELFEEQVLVEQARKDPDSFGRLFDEYYPRLYRYALKRTADPHAAQDITAEVFFKAYARLWQFVWRRLPFGSWLYKIATNEINDYFRRGRMAPVPVAFLEELEHLAISEHTPLAELEAKEQLQEDHALFLRVQAGLYELSSKYQSVLALRYFERKSIAEIAQILGKREGTVKSLLSRGLKNLQRHMQPLEAGSVVPAEGSKKVIINQPPDYEQPTA